MCQVSVSAIHNTYMSHVVQWMLTSLVRDVSYRNSGAVSGSQMTDAYFVFSVQMKAQLQSRPFRNWDGFRIL